MNEGGRRTILVIDDTPEDIAVLREELKTDYRVLAAINHEAAMGIVHSSPPPDLILLDVMMPGTDGYKLCGELKADPATRDIPVIFVTTQDAAENEATGFAVGGVDYIVKPVNPLLVMARVKTHLALKAAREDLERQNEILRDTVRLREEVEAINRHDLKNPLMIVMSVPGVVLADSSLSAGNRKLLQMVDEAGRRMLEMVNGTIDLFKMEKGTYVLTPEDVDVCPIIERIMTTLRMVMDAKGMTFTLTHRGLPVEGLPFTVRGEDLLVYSLLANLLKNAVEASPVGAPVTIGLDEDAMAVITINNAGVIPETIRGRFFEKFATSGKQGGTGLGAYSAKLMAATLGGSIGFETSDERGTTITVMLPPGNP